MRAIFLNWRDLSHPRAGGAEVLAQGLATRLASAGHDVVFYSARVAGRPDEETVDGLRHVRRGSRLGVYGEAYRWLRGTKQQYDLLIDHINTVPFFTPLYERERNVALVPQLARDIWWYEAPAIVAAVGIPAERLYNRLYRTTPAITISESTASDLRTFGWRGPVRTIAMPIPAAGQEAEKARRPTVAFVGRLTPSKRVEHALDAFALVRTQMPDATLWIAGSADDPRYERRLRDIATQIGGVEFLGYVSQEERRRRMAAANVIVVPSVREGWGLVVTEANALGTPAVGYDVAGLRDSIKPGQGILVPAGDARMLGTEIARLLADPVRLADMSSRARLDAEQYSWERTYHEFVQALRALRPRLGL
jgi:glycosyltransferase involved in cell wall biosynthesis